ncbi:uncharacterized protein LOC103944575 [Pyrus x bretschneideri]|uniref:uncharacterized protein LOC103944575 n=1 Tax=Pyrus x bretschneideri TaxID=225117 RepID=UPI00202E97D2|nr:uncharacterized protein LOC103944575 [Pyrus x bretschneideri]
MAWWEGFEETRLLIAADTTESGDDVGQLISLRHPKSGNKMCYLFVNGVVLQELNWFKQSCTFWCLGEYVTAEVGSSKFFRLDDSKVLAWLYHKVCQLKQTISTLDHNYAAREEKDMYNFMTDAVSVLGEYVKDEPWLKLLIDCLRIDFTEATRKMSDIEFLPTATGSNLVPCNGSQEKG